MNKIAKFLTISALLCLTKASFAEFNWNVSLGLPIAAPVYPTYVVQRPVYRVVHQAPVAPSLGLSFGDENFGFGLQIPLTSPTRYDREGYDYWEIENNTDDTIYVTNRNGQTIRIRPDGIKTLSHENSLRLTIKDQFGRTIKTRVQGHYLIVEQNRSGRLVVIES